MKTLILVRHAKTEADAVDDWHRQLTDRGREQARSLGEVLAAQDLPDDLVVYHSTALRAAQTWEQIAPALGHGVVVRETPGLYAFEEDEILQTLREVDEAEQTLLVIGHNPGISELASTLTGAELDGDRSVSKYGALRTCRGVILDYDGLWCDLDSQDCTARTWLAPTVD